MLYFEFSLKLLLASCAVLSIVFFPEQLPQEKPVIYNTTLSHPRGILILVTVKKHGSLSGA